MLEIVKGHWNNSESTHNCFQDFMKWFGIITKSKQIAKIRKQKVIEKQEREEAYLGHLPAAHLAPHLAQQCGWGPALLPTVFNLYQ